MLERIEKFQATHPGMKLSEIILTEEGQAAVRLTEAERLSILVRTPTKLSPLEKQKIELRPKAEIKKIEPLPKVEIKKAEPLKKVAPKKGGGGAQ